MAMLTADQLRAALARAFNLGSTYWRQADSESYAQNRRSDDTGAKFEALVTETVAALAVQGTSSALSNFIRNATPEEKAKVYGAVMDKVSEQQRAVIDCAPPCHNASMAGGCPCGYADCTKRTDGVMGNAEFLKSVEGIGPVSGPDSPDSFTHTAPGVKVPGAGNADQA